MDTFLNSFYYDSHKFNLKFKNLFCFDFLKNNDAVLLSDSFKCLLVRNKNEDKLEILVLDECILMGHWTGKPVRCLTGKNKLVLGVLWAKNGLPKFYFFDVLAELKSIRHVFLNLNLDKDELKKVFDSSFFLVRGGLNEGSKSTCFELLTKDFEKDPFAFFRDLVETCGNFYGKFFRPENQKKKEALKRYFDIFSKKPKVALATEMVNKLFRNTEIIDYLNVFYNVEVKMLESKLGLNHY